MYSDIAKGFYNDYSKARQAYNAATLDAKKREALDNMTIAMQLMSLALDIESKATYIESIKAEDSKVAE